MYAYFNRFEFKMTLKQARECFHPGACDEDVKAALEIPAIYRQFKRIDSEDIKAELLEYGAWDEQELSDQQVNQMRIVWLAAGDIVENSKED